MSADLNFQVKNKIFPRSCYISEFDTIWEKQAQFYPSIFTESFKKQVKDKIIFYQRPLKSQKGLVTKCTLESQHVLLHQKDTKSYNLNAAPKSSPLNQLCTLLETLNHFRIKDREYKEIEITSQIRNEILEELLKKGKISLTELQKKTGLFIKNGYIYPKQMVEDKGLKGDTTYARFLAVAGSDFCESILNCSTYWKFDNYLSTFHGPNITTGEIEEKPILSPEIFNHPYYKIWHAIYSIDHEEDLIKYLTIKHGIDLHTAEKLAKIDFTKDGFSRKSSKAIRKLLPHLIQGYNYDSACKLAGFRHSDYETKEENANRALDKCLALIPKNSLRQPVVERILNQMINLVNAILKDEKDGGLGIQPDEIRVELARELKQNAKERKKTLVSNSKREKNHKIIEDRLTKEYPGIKVTRKLIEKVKLFEETGGLSIYTGKMISFPDVIKGDFVDVEHIIPKSLFFDDSFSNKILCERSINLAKGNMTAYEFMKAQPIPGLQSFDDFLETIRRLKEKEDGISSTKYERLVTDHDGIPDDFIERQLRQSQFIAKEAVQLLKKVCRTVTSTSGSVTDYLREKWGWNDVLKNLNWSKYEAAGLTYFDDLGNKKIQDWSKRDDHRHHAIDALVIACTKQSFIQSLNKLSQTVNRKNGQATQTALKEDQLDATELLTKDKIIASRPFTTKEVEKAIAQILISYKPGKRLFSKSKNRAKTKDGIIVQTTVIPRGPLSEESVYGKILVQELQEKPLNKTFNPEWIVADKKIRKLVKERLFQFGNDPEKAFKKPIYLDPEETQQLKKVQIRVMVPEYVIKYPITSIVAKDIQYVVDEKVKNILQQRCDEALAKGIKEKDVFKDVGTNPIWFNKEKGIQIKTVRLLAKLNVVQSIHDKIENGHNPLSKKHLTGQQVDYVKPGSNHHIAIYKDETGKLFESVVTFAEAFERAKQGYPVIAPKDEEGRLLYMSLQQNEMVVSGLNRSEIEDLIQKNQFSELSRLLFRVRKLTSGNYWFNHHLETQPRESVLDKKLGIALYCSKSSLNIQKVKIDTLGRISLV